MRCLFVVLLLVSSCSWLKAEEEKGGKSDLIVHEWGVLMRKVTFPPTLGPAEELLESLPDFVHFHSTYKPQEVFRPWNKPVIHFYGNPQEVSVEILTVSGRPAAYWPKPTLLEETFWRMGDGMIDAVGMQWKGTLRAKPEEGTVPKVKEGDWWEKARGVDSLWFSQKDEADRFIFYEGTGLGEPTISTRIEGEKLILHNKDSEPAGMVLVILNDGENRFVAEVDAIAPGAIASISQKELRSNAVTNEELEAISARQWKSYGMTDNEANAIASIWEEDLWENKGFLVVSRMPSHIYDKYIFPIKIEPKPDELVRAAVIFDTLPGIDGRLAWLPKLVPELETLLEQLSSPDPSVREKSTTRLSAYGDLARDVLVAESKEKEGELERKMRVKALLERLQPKPAANIPTHMGKGSQELRISNEFRLGRPVEIEGTLGVRQIERREVPILIHESYGEVVLRDLKGEVKKGEKVALRGRFIPSSYGYYRFGSFKEDKGWVFKIESK